MKSGWKHRVNRSFGKPRFIYFFLITVICSFLDDGVGNSVQLRIVGITVTAGSKA
jgi:hypothetical protein